MYNYKLSCTASHHRYVVLFYNDRDKPTGSGLWLWLDSVGEEMSTMHNVEISNER